MTAGALALQGGHMQCLLCWPCQDRAAGAPAERVARVVGVSLNALSNAIMAKMPVTLLC